MLSNYLKPKCLGAFLKGRSLYDWRALYPTAPDGLTQLWFEYGGAVGFDERVVFSPTDMSGLEGLDGCIAVEYLLGPGNGLLGFEKYLELTCRAGVDGVPVAALSGGNFLVEDKVSAQIFIWLPHEDDDEQQLFLAFSSFDSLVQGLQIAVEETDMPEPVALVDRGLDELIRISREGTVKVK